MWFCSPHVDMLRPYDNEFVSSLVLGKKVVLLKTEGDSEGLVKMLRVRLEVRAGDVVT